MAKSKFTEDTPEMEEKKSGSNFRRSNRTRSRKTGGGKNAKTSKRASSNKSGYHGSNDISWYTLTPELLDSTTKLNFNIPTGKLTPDQFVEDVGTHSVVAGSGSADVSLEPSIMDQERGVLSISLVPTYGIANDPTDAINKAAMVLYNTERSANASVVNFDATDNMKVVLAYDSGLAWLAFLKRLYGTISNFAFINKFTPDTLVRAMGVDFTDIMRNRLNLYNHINLLVSRMKAFVMPNGMSLMDRHEYLFEHIFMDVADPKGYFMLYNPKFLYRYKAVQQSGDSCLETIYIGPIKDSVTNAKTYMTYEDLVDISELIIGSWNDQDFVTIGAEMLKAFQKIGGNARREVLPIPEDYIVQFEYDLNWLSQVQNMSWINLGYPTYTGTLPSDNGWRRETSQYSNVSAIFSPYTVVEVIPNNPNTSPYLQTFASYTAEMPSTYGNHLLLSRLATPQSADIMYSTRLIFNEEFDPQSSSVDEPSTGEYITELKFDITSCGSELAIGVELFGVDEPWDVELQPSVGLFTSDNVVTWVNQQPGYAIQAILGLINMDRYNFHPQIRVFMALAGDDNGQMYFKYDGMMPAADLDNFAVLSKNQLSWMHDTAMQALCMVRLTGIEEQFK